MANPHRGEVDLHAGDDTYTLRLSINSIAEIENLLDLGINEIAAALSDIAKLRLGTLRAVVWGALHEHHPNLTLVDAGEIIGKAGVEKITEAIQESFRLAFPAAEGASPSPEAKSAGTGKAS